MRRLAASIDADVQFAVGALSENERTRLTDMRRKIIHRVNVSAALFAMYRKHVIPHGLKMG